MSYFKLCQICDKGLENEDFNGSNYVEDVNKNILVMKSISFPLQVLAEVIDFATFDNFNKKGSAVQFNQEVVTVPNNAISIRDSVFNQLLVKYPTLVK